LAIAEAAFECAKQIGDAVMRRESNASADSSADRKLDEMHR
jgi:hypothetical protein